MQTYATDPDDALVVAFLDGVRTGRSPGLRIEGDVLGIEDGDLSSWPVLIRLAPATHLLRTDPADRVHDTVRDRIRGRLSHSGAGPIDVDPPELNDVAAMCVTGLRLSRWQLWSCDETVARRALEAALMGDPTVRTPTTSDVTSGPMAIRLLEELDAELDEVAQALWRDGG